MTKIPRFFLVGLPRSGSTSLDQYLREHPEIFMAPKDSHFFTTDACWGYRKPYTQDQYLSFFTEAEQEQTPGESSVSYIMSDTAADHIRSFNPNAKIIILIRNPVDVVYSLFSLQKKANREQGNTFEQALEKEKERLEYIKNNHIVWDKNLDIDKYSFYRTMIKKLNERIKKFIQLFGKENVKIVIYEDLKNDTDRCYREILEFLGVNPNFKANYKIHNANREKRKYAHLFNWLFIPMAKLGDLVSRQYWIPELIRKDVLSVLTFIRRFCTESTKKRTPLPKELERSLREEFSPVVKELEEITGRDLSGWV